MSTNQFTCEFCHNTYSSLSSLNFHKKSSKTCLQIQNKELEFPCEHCNKEFASLYTLQAHLLVCKQKKHSETTSLAHERDLLIKERDFYKMRTIHLEEQVKYLQEQNSKLIATKHIPTSTTITENSNNTNSNNTNSNNSYNTQFNTLFNNLIVFNCNNVSDSIKGLMTEEHIAQLDLNDIQKSILKDLVLHSINKFTFCTDSKRNIIVTKNATGEQTKTKLDDFLEDYVHYGKDEIHNYLDYSHKYIDERINNDELPDDSTWYNFEKTKDHMNKTLKDAYKADDIKSTELFKDMHTYIKTNGTKLKKGK